MNTSGIIDAKKYINKLADILSDCGMIDNPKQLFELIELSIYKNEIVGWQIYNKELQFITGDYLDCDEFAIFRGNYYVFTYCSYHFCPEDYQQFFSYRIDLDSEGFHFNPDSRIENTLGHRIEPNDLPIDIRQFNCLLAIHLALLYIRYGIYPTESQAKQYEKALNGIRRKLV